MFHFFGEGRDIFQDCTLIFLSTETTEHTIIKEQAVKSLLTVVGCWLVKVLYHDFWLLGYKGSRGGAVVRAIAFHQCGLGSNSGINLAIFCNYTMKLSLSQITSDSSLGKMQSLFCWAFDNIPANCFFQILSHQKIIKINI